VSRPFIAANQPNRKHMKLDSKLLLALSLFALPLGASAQTTAAAAAFGAKAGEHEFTLGGAGGSNRRFSDSFGGASFSYGYFFNDTQELSLRQSINYSNSGAPGARQAWNGATRLAFDQHFGAMGAFRPFVGANFGGAYGRSVNDTFAAGIEVGGKYYVQAHTFVYAIPEYNWFFRHARGINHEFSDGQFNWSLGVGYNF
jgi:hypothetical protein